MDADALYALAPEDFTAARDAAAKQARADGDKAGAALLKALRRPSVSAWLVNRLAAEQRDLLDQLLALGPALAQAQSSGRADDLRTLGQQRRALVEAVTDTALQRRTSSQAVRDEVAATLEAALADPASADAVRSGRLVRALSYAGFGGVDLSGAVADAPAPARAVPVETAGAAQRDEQERAHREAVGAAEQAAQEAAGRLDDAVRAAERAERAGAEAAAGLADAEQAVERARTVLAAAEADREAARQVREQADAAAAEAVEQVRRAQDRAERARRDLDGLRRRP